MDTRAIRQRAAEIVRDGWCQGKFVDHHGYCMVGALARAAGVSYADLDEGLIDELRDELAVEWLSDWNDEPGRTAEEVARALEGRYKSITGMEPQQP